MAKRSKKKVVEKSAGTEKLSKVLRKVTAPVEALPETVLESIVVEEVAEPVPGLPVAEPNEGLARLITAVAKKTTRKFLGGRWWNLQVEQSVTGPKEVIDALRRGGFVK